MSDEQKRTRTGTTFAQRALMLTCTALVILAILAGAAWGLWRLVASVEHGILAAWALLATAMIPACGYACYRLGQTESRGVVNGIAAGVGAVSRTANDIAQVKIHTAHAIRSPGQLYPAALPEQVVIDIEPEPAGHGPIYV